MKKQINSVTTMSLKTKISLTVLCAFLGATEVNANNYSSVGLNNISKEVKTESKTENRINRISTVEVLNNNEEVADEQITDELSQWIAESSYWSVDDSMSADQKKSENNMKSAKDCQSKCNAHTENKSFIFSPEHSILNSEF